MIVYWCAMVGIFILAVTLTVHCSRIAYSIGYNIFHDTPYQEYNEQEVIVTVSKGCSIQEMAKELEKEEIIADDFVFCIQAMLHGYQLIPGEYVISPSMKSEDILKILNGMEVEEET